MPGGFQKMFHLGFGQEVLSAAVDGLFLTFLLHLWKSLFTLRILANNQPGAQIPDFITLRFDNSGRKEHFVKSRHLFSDWLREVKGGQERARIVSKSVGRKIMMSGRNG
jgi:hypothetical protein